MESWVNFIDLIPVCFAGILSGLASYFLENEENCFWKKIVYAETVSILIYMILTATDLNYMARIGIAAFVAFIGLEKALDLVQQILSYRKGK